MLIRRFFGLSKRKVIVTGAGFDRIGLVKDITGIIFDEDGNISDSRMTKLEQNFALMMLVEIPEQNFASFEERIRKSKESLGIHLDVNDLKPKVKEVVVPEEYSVCIDTIADDQPGLVYALTQKIAGIGGNIEKIDTFKYSAPMGGTTLFKIKAKVKVNKLIDFDKFRQNLKAMENNHTIDISIYKEGEESTSSSDE